jgi:phage terminase small subunit
MAKKKAPAKKAKKLGTSKAAAEARRHAFVEAYISNGGNATSAAISAGFPIRSAGQRGHELVKDREIQALLKQRNEQVLEHLKVDDRARPAQADDDRRG